MINGLLDDLDFTKLKLPIEPKHLIYVFLAYKLINNLDKLHLDSPNPMHRIPKQTNPMPSILILMITLFSFYILFGNMTSQILVPSQNKETKIYVSDCKPNRSKCTMEECEMINKCPINISDCYESMKNCPLKKGKCPMKMTKCPLRMCPLFTDSDKLNELIEKCISEKTNNDEEINNDEDSGNNKK